MTSGEKTPVVVGVDAGANLSLLLLDGCSLVDLSVGISCPTFMSMVSRRRRGLGRPFLAYKSSKQKRDGMAQTQESCLV